MKLFDEYGDFVGEVGQLRKPLTEEERQRICRRRQKHYTKRWVEKKLLANVTDESLPAKERHEALLARCKLRGYFRAPKSNG